MSTAYSDPFAARDWLPRRSRQLAIVLAITGAGLLLLRPASIGLPPHGVHLAMMRAWCVIVLLLAFRALARRSLDTIVPLAPAAGSGVLISLQGQHHAAVIVSGIALCLCGAATLDVTGPTSWSRAAYYMLLAVSVAGMVLLGAMTRSGMIGDGAEGLLIVVALGSIAAARRAPSRRLPWQPAADMLPWARRGTEHPAPGTSNSIWAYAMEDDKRLFLAADGTSFIAYRLCAGVALAAGDPLCPPERRAVVAGEFVAFCRQHGWTPALYQVLESEVDEYRAAGLRAVKIGEEALIDLPRFTLAGKKIANVRHCVTHSEREGLVAEVLLEGVQDEETYQELESVSEAWMGSRSGRGEMGFSMGAFGRKELAKACVVMARNQSGHACAFVTFRRVDGACEYVLDLMRRRPDAPSGTIDFLIARALEHLRDSGSTTASLSLAPLSGTREHGRSPRVERLLAMLFERGNSLYRYRSLYNFKRKFTPRWESRYLIVPSGLPSLARALLAVTLVHMPKRQWRAPRLSTVAAWTVAYVRQCLDWRAGLQPRALATNLRLMGIITFVLSWPELRAAWLQYAGHTVSRPYAIAAIALAAANIAGAVLLARRRELGRRLIQLGSLAFFVKTAWAFTHGYDGGMISLAIALVLAPVEVWVFWFLSQPEVSAWEQRDGAPDRARAGTTERVLTA